MPTDLLTWLRVLDAGAMAAFAARLFATGLFRNYKALAAHTVLELVEAAMGLALPVRSSAYFYFFIAGCIPRWSLWFLILNNLRSRSLSLAPSLTTASNWVVRFGLGAGLMLVAATGWIDYAQYGPLNMALPFVFFAERTTAVLFGLFLLALAAMLAWFSVPVARNVAFLCVGLAVVFSSRAAVFALGNYLGASIIHNLSLIATGLSAVVFLFWAVRISVAGESAVRFVSRRPEPEEIERSIERLSQAATLARSRN